MKIWIHHFTLESNWLSVEWTATGKNRPKPPKTQMSAGKVLTSIFWDAQDILYIDYLEKGRTINSKYYIALLKEEIPQNWSQMKKEKVLFHQDNAPCYKSIPMRAKLYELYFELLPHPPYSPDLPPRDYPTVCRPQKNAPGKKIWLQWRSDIGNWGVFWGQRQIVLQNWIVREALEYHLERDYVDE